MYIYNVTTQLSWSIHHEWLKWMKEYYIPAVVASGCFTHHRMVRLLEVDETGGPTYAVQYFTDSLDTYRRYITLFAPDLGQQTLKMWGEACISFGSVMEVVH